MAEITRMLAANIRRQFFFVITTIASTRFLVHNFQLKADFVSSQKPLAASQQVLASWQNNFLSSHEYDNLMNIVHWPSWSFKQRQLNQAITITLRLT